MFRLTREVRFAINHTPDDQLAHKPTNSYGGFPSLTGFGIYLAFQVTLEGDLDPATGYLRNIKEIDDAVRQHAVPATIDAARDCGATMSMLVSDLMNWARQKWPGACRVGLSLSPFLSLQCLASEHPMVRLSQKFEFSASHRLHNPALGDEENRRRFGKCNNPQGHGHNYELQVTLKGDPTGGAMLTRMPEIERVVAATVIDRFDHKNLNAEVAEFREVIPTVENIAKTIYQLLKPKLNSKESALASVTVWETPKTWCEYSE